MPAFRGMVESRYCLRFDTLLGTRSTAPSTAGPLPKPAVDKSTKPGIKSRQGVKPTYDPAACPSLHAAQGQGRPPRGASPMHNTMIFVHGRPP
jgi:hypothetical protein